MKSKYNIKTKTHNLYKIIFLFIVFLGIGYAFLEASLNINGDVTVTAPELNVYVQSTSVTSGSTSGTPTIIGNDKKEVDFTTALTSDVNSFFETSITLTNKGCKDAYLQSIDVKVYDSNNNEVTLSTPYEYNLTKSDGTQVEIGKKVTVGSTDAYKIKFNYISGTDMSTVTTYPSYTFKLIYNYGLTVPCINEDITILSATKCTTNENITVPNGTICKRAINLHQEECNQTDSTLYCSGAGYSQGDKITYGNCGTSGTLTSGDAFTCDVNGDEMFDELLERFYYVSDYYDTTQKDFDTTTASLIYYNSVVGGSICNKGGFAYSNIEDIKAVDSSVESYDNWHGPLTIMKQLPTSFQWPNINLKNSSRQILSKSNTNRTLGGVLPSNFSYNGYSARLLTYQEIQSACGNTGMTTNGYLDNCNYLIENTTYSKNIAGRPGIWLETPDDSNSTNVLFINGNTRSIYNIYSFAFTEENSRPVIEVPKSKIIY